MSDNDSTLTSAEFSKRTGIAVSTITQMLRQGKLCGEKRSGKWAIFESELESQAVAGTKDRRKPSLASPGPIFETQTTSGKTFDVETFAGMTYLTEHGVRQWLKSGRLSGRIEIGGKALIDASNFERPDFQHLIRK